MSEPIAPPGGHDTVRAAIRRAADATGVDFSLLAETARRESALDPHARAGTSSATGLFQFIESTWLDMVRRHGAEHGLGAEAAALQRGADAQTRRDILALRNDPELSARMAGELAHVLGSGGAARLIEAAANGAPNAAEIFPREAAANRGLFYVSGEARSAQGLLARLSLDADADIGARNAGGRLDYARGDAPMSPALAQALFAMALLPLLNNHEEREARDPLQALSAYRSRSEI
jgi:hypothetical protein